ncbi:N-acetylneuraminate synthase [Tepidibacillus sp. HK-1]|uniref:N-acetylneuraminate synthase n=1 Tax=Tepidibacillus sp. HK-1 TaxID=1883407 RepID=UPI000853BE5A|nr:N-acetylneuraminate synthase [Tepidibacillus sp. HK-1]GBF10547.1 N,N'-diacetyllegionaminic acid synthase [Tepidibacillus sp. HK-1]
MIQTHPRTFIIAEAGVNHNGSLELAKRLVDIAVEAGADAIKFQTFKANKISVKNAPKADYQKKTTDNNESQFDMLKKLELDEFSHKILIDYADEKGIEFLSTPFDLESAEFLTTQLNLSKIKISSGDITNAPLLLKIAKTGTPVILSTGMSSLSEIEAALSVLAYGYTNLNEEPSLEVFQKAYARIEGQQVLQEKVTLLHCTSEYPAPFDEVNLKAMDTIKHAFQLPVGLSDHTTGIAIPIAAVARGARIIEKHFTLNKNLPGPDHKASLEPDELKEMIRSIRQVEIALGSPIKSPTLSELNNKTVVRKSLIAATKIKKGEHFTEKNLTVKRPGNGISPMHYWDWLNKTSDKDYEANEMVRP